MLLIHAIRVGNRLIQNITGPVDKVTAVKMNVKGAANW